MRQLLWATDVHLDHVGPPNAARTFGELLRRSYPTSEGLIVTGDIAEGRTVAETLRELSEAYGGPLHFVLGNHDYYRAHFRTVDADVDAVNARTDKLNWLRKSPVVIDEQTALVGSGGWYDARYGDPESPLQLNDFMLIGEIFEALDKSRLRMLEVLRERADFLMETLLQQTRQLLRDSTIRHLIVATHVPPFAEAAWHNGRGANGTWAPYFSSKATGDALLELAAEFPRVYFTTLCGHSHGHGTYSASHNLTVHTGRARYGFPEVAGVLQLSPAGVSVSVFENPQNDDT